MAKALQHLEQVQGSKLDLCLLTKFDHVDSRKSWGMLIDRMYIKCITLVFYDMFLYNQYENIYLNINMKLQIYYIYKYILYILYK